MLVLISQKTFFVVTANRVTLCSEVIRIYCHNYKKHINTIWVS